MSETPEIEPGRALSDDQIREADAAVEEAHSSITADLARLGRLIDRADAEASRLRAHRLRVWREARELGLTWREIAAASGVDHSSVAKTVGNTMKGKN